MNVLRVASHNLRPVVINVLTSDFQEIGIMFGTEINWMQQLAFGRILFAMNYPNELFNLDFSVVTSYAIFMSPVIETLFYFVHNQSLLSDSYLKWRKHFSVFQLLYFSNRENSEAETDTSYS